MSKILDCSICDYNFKWSRANPEKPAFCPQCGNTWAKQPPHTPGLFHKFVLAQDEIWIDKDGYEHEIGNMPRSYIANVVGYLLRNSQRFRVAYTEADYFDLQDKIGGKDPATGWLPFTGGLTREQDQNWMTRSPLTRRLMGELIG